MQRTRGGGRPRDGYYLRDGRRVPGTTTITGRGKDSGGLVFVAKKNWHEAGRLGHPFDRDAYWSGPEGGNALLAGTIVHQWIEDHLHGDEQTEYPNAPAGVIQNARIGFKAFEKWTRQVRLSIIETEVPLVSTEYEFGGTIDMIATIMDERALWDWKTSNATYPDYIAQLAAYRQLLRERDGVAAPTEAYLVRLGKQMGDFHVHYWPENVLDEGWEWFMAAKRLHEQDSLLKKVAT